MIIRQLLRCAVALPLALSTGWVVAQTYPSKPVTIVVPFPAGGALDTVARALAEQMRTDPGQVVILDNRAGAGGTPDHPRDPGATLTEAPAHIGRGPAER